MYAMLAFKERAEYPAYQRSTQIAAYRLSYVAGHGSAQGFPNLTAYRTQYAAANILNQTVFLCFCFLRFPGRFFFRFFLCQRRFLGFLFRNFSLLSYRRSK